MSLRVRIKKLLILFLILSLFPWSGMAALSELKTCGSMPSVLQGSQNQLQSSYLSPLPPPQSPSETPTPSYTPSVPVLPTYTLPISVSPFDPPAPTAEGYVVTWEPSSVYKVVHLGETVTTTVTFMSQEDLSDVHFSISNDELKDITTIVPRTISTVKAGQQNSISLMFQIPSSFPGNKSLLEGELHLRAGQGNSDSSTVPALLKIHLEIRPGPPPPTNFIDGQVLDSGSGLPLSGATVGYIGTTGSTTTDANGNFSLPVTGPGNFSISIAKSGYTSAQRMVNVVAGVDAAAGAIDLTPLDSAQTVIGPAGGVATNSTGTVKITFPAGAVSQNITVVATQLTLKKALPGPLPPSTPLAYSVDLEALEFPQGITFNVPVTVEIKNTIGFPPNGHAPLGTWNPLTLHWDDLGQASITSDGAYVEFQITHFSTYTACCALELKQITGSAPGSAQSIGSDTLKSKDPCTNCPLSNHGVEIHSGNLDPSHSIPSYRSLGVSRSVSLTYHSDRADPNNVIQTAIAEGFPGMEIPQTEGFELDVAGVQQSAVYQGTFGNANMGYWFHDTSGSGNPLPTGAYPYQMTIHNYYPAHFAAAACFGCPPIPTEVTTASTPEPGSVTNQSSGMVTVVRDTGNPAGNGWEADVPQAHFSTGGSILITEKSGTSLFARNGGFETGTTEGFYASGAYTMLEAVQQAGPITPPEGQTMAMMTQNCTSRCDPMTLETGLFTIPAGTTSLSFQVNVLSQTGSMIPMNVSLSTPTGIYTNQISGFPFTSIPNFNAPYTLEGDTSQAGQTTSQSGWQIVTLNVSSLAGTNIPVKLSIQLASQNDWEFLLFDDFRYDTGAPLLFTPRKDFSTLTENSDGSLARRMKDGTIQNFDTGGKLTSAVDRNGNTTSFTYDSNGNLLATTDPAGLSTTFSYTGSLLTTITDPSGRATKLVHDSFGNLTQIVNPDNTTRDFSYDSTSHLLSETDSNGNVTQYTYDSFGRVHQLIFPTGETRTFYPRDVGSVINLLPPGTGTESNPAPVTSILASQVVDGNGNTWTYGAAQPWSIYGDEIFDPLRRLTRTYRDPNGLSILYITPMDFPFCYPGNFSEDNCASMSYMAYDMMGNLMAVNPNPGPIPHLPLFLPMDFLLATTTQKAYFGPSVYGGDPLGNEREYFTYEPLFNQVTSVTDTKGNKTSLAYDSHGNPTQITDALGNVTNLTYNAQGLLLTSTDSLGHTTAFAYNTSGNLVSVTDPLGRVTSLFYDANGNVNEVLDPEGHATTYAYDSSNQLTTVTDVNGGVTHYTYDANGNLISVTDALGHTNTFAYNPVDLLASVTNPLGYTKLFSYDLNRNLTNMTDFKGQATAFQYDVTNKLTRKTTVSDTTTYQYTPGYHLASVAKSTGNLNASFYYDFLGRPAATETRNSDFAEDGSQSYDSVGNPTLQTETGSFRSGPAWQYLDQYRGYDSLNRPTSITNNAYAAAWDGRTSGYEPSNITYAYDALSRRTKRTTSAILDPAGTYAPTVQTSYTYDAASQLASFTQTRTDNGEQLSQTGYTYDNDGNRVSMTDDAGTHAYAYDSLSRLTSATHPNQPAEQYTYDAVGNRLSSQRSPSYVYDAANRLLSDATYNYAYDPNGNLTSKTSKATGENWQFTYDGEDQLVQAQHFPQNSATPDHTTQYAYDPFGKRYETISDGNDYFTTYLGAQPIATLQKGGQGFLNTVLPGAGMDEIAGILRLSPALQFDAETPLADGLGSITRLLDLSGNTIQTNVYDSAGNIVSQAGTPLSSQPYSYTGRPFDTIDGFYNLRAREYDPDTGRFTQEDPIGFSGGMNFYSYVADNPLRYTDPLGLDYYDIDQAIQYWNQLQQEELQSGNAVGASIAQISSDLLQYGGPAEAQSAGNLFANPNASLTSKIWTGVGLAVAAYPGGGGEEFEVEGKTFRATVHLLERLKQNGGLCGQEVAEEILHAKNAVKVSGGVAGQRFYIEIGKLRVFYEKESHNIYHLVSIYVP